MKIKVVEATNLQLDWLVVRALQVSGVESYIFYSPKLGAMYNSATDQVYRPTTDLAQGGSILFGARIEIRYHDVIVAGIWYRDGIGRDEQLHKATGPTELVAGLRCYVISVLGEEVEIPKELT